MRWVCNFCSTFCEPLYLANIIPDRIRKCSKDFCSRCVEMALHLQKPSRTTKCPAQQKHSLWKRAVSTQLGGSNPWSPELRATQTAGSFFSTNTTLSKSQTQRETETEREGMSPAGRSPGPYNPFLQGGAGVQPLERGTEHYPDAPGFSLTAEVCKSLIVPPGMEKKSPGDD